MKRSRFTEEQSYAILHEYWHAVGQWPRGEISNSRWFTEFMYYWWMGGMTAKQAHNSVWWERDARAHANEGFGKFYSCMKTN